MIYAIEFADSARREVRKLDPTTKRRILAAIDGLSADPRKGQVRRMVGVSSWRLRVGDHRVVYDIEDNKLAVLVIRVRHRREAYRK